MFLPLHAAGTYGVSHAECCSDYIVSSYTPTLSALLRAQKSNQRFNKVEAKLSLISATKAQDAHLPTLWNVEEEMRYIQAVAEEASIGAVNNCTGKKAGIWTVAEAFKSTNMAHIACHGIQDRRNGLWSGFSLSDGMLTVSQLMDLHLKDAFFAFLSACDTAKADEKQPDQTVHLAATMLFVGFRSVVATMWYIL
jgi:CHAT domain-containing protein